MRKTICFLTYLCITIFSSATFAFTPNNIIIFGDSLSDVGYQDKNPDLKEGKTPIYTSPGGHVWGYYLIKDLSLNLAMVPNNENPPANNKYVSGALNGNDFAAGGATTSGIGIGIPGKYNPPSLQQQVDLYLHINQNIEPDQNDLFIIWIGANNFLEAIGNKKISPKQLKKIADKAVGDIAHSVDQLKQKGVQHIIIMNLPNLGKTPYVNNHPLLADYLSTVSMYFDHQLNHRLLSVSGVHIFSTYSLIDRVIKNKTYDNFTFSNVTSAACATPDDKSPNAFFCFPPTGRQAYLFEDVVHPTDFAHQAIAKALAKYILVFL
jgi:outer membrane lipase/esterase